MHITNVPNRERFWTPYDEVIGGVWQPIPITGAKKEFED
jgi:hypothetical protein